MIYKMVVLNEDTNRHSNHAKHVGARGHIILQGKSEIYTTGFAKRYLLHTNILHFETS